MGDNHWPLEAAANQLMGIFDRIAGHHGIRVPAGPTRSRLRSSSLHRRSVVLGLMAPVSDSNVFSESLRPELGVRPADDCVDRVLLVDELTEELRGIGRPRLTSPALVHSFERTGSPPPCRFLGGVSNFSPHIGQVRVSQWLSL